MAGPSAIRAGRAFVELFADDSMLVRTLRRAEARIVKFGENIKSIGRRLATLGVAAGTPFAISMKVFRDFDDQMRAVKAVTGATGKEFDMLTEKAKFLGRTTSFTASQVASAMLELGRAGFAPKEIDEAIPSVLNLARATGTELATSAEICANTLRSFELPASEMVRVSDVMVAAANNSAQTLEDLGESMSYCAPIASEYGLSLEQTAKALGSLANYGIKGSQAGTTLRRVLTNLADSRVQKRLQGIGVAVVDQDTGRMQEVSEVLRDVGAATQTMAKDKKLGLFKQLFGLYAIAGGAKLTVAQFDKLIEAVDNAAGTGARAAKEMDSGIGGSLRMMWSAVEGVAIAIGEALAPSLQKLTDWFTAATSGMVKYLTKNKQIVVQAAKIITAITGIGIGLLVLGGTLIAVGKIFGIVATVIASVAKIGLIGFSLLSGAISAVTMTIGTVISAFAGVAGMIGAVFGGVATALSVLATVGTTVFGMIGTVIAAAFSPLGLVIISLGAVAGACFLVYRNASAIGNAISKVFQNIVGTVKNAATSVYAFLNRFTEFKIIFGTINIVRDGLHLLGQTILWVGNSIVKPVFSVIFSVFRKLIGITINVAKAVGSTLVSGFQRAVGIVSTVFRGLVSIVTSVTGKVVSVVGNVFSGIASVVVRILSPVLNIIGAVFRGILRFISPIVTALRTVTGWIVSFARSFFVVESAVQIFSLFSSAIRGAASLFSTMAGTVISTIFSIAQSIPSVISSIVRFFIALPGKILNVFSQIPRIVGGAFSAAVSVVRNIVSGIGNVFSGITTGIVRVCTEGARAAGSLLRSSGTLVGNFFLDAFANVGTAVDWLREQFGNLCSFASETVGAIVTALGRGDIEAVIQLVWATIKLIWTQGTTSLVSTWHWLVETLQTTWATCVYKISELLTTAWYGVQEFWTETVYTMSTLWTEFSSGVVSAWKTAEQAIAQGIGWIMAKMQGLDPNEMVSIINEDYNRQSQQREAAKSQALTGIQQRRDEKMSSLQSEKDGTLDILKRDFETNAGIRDAAYQAKLAAQQKELDAAKAAYDEAIHRAKNPPQGEESQSLVERLQAKVQEVIKGFQANSDLGSKVSVSGSFSAAAIASMGASSVMDRVAKATEKSEKHLQKMADKVDSDAADTEIPDEPDENDGMDENLMTKELKQQTRYLRDIAQNGGNAFA